MKTAIVYIDDGGRVGCWLRLSRLIVPRSLYLLMTSSLGMTLYVTHWLVDDGRAWMLSSVLIKALGSP